ncbi:MAG: hypothetical protein M1815_004413 [Lichina confinis]|nr:MAG: hypothetical protein M1815_004413 [Lichina confinis]
MDLEELSGPGSKSFQLDRDNYTLSVCGETFEERTANAASLATLWRTKGTFKVLRAWRDELYPVYGPGKELLYNIERAASPLLGIVRYGVHMTAYVRTADGMKIWVPRRSKIKMTYGGMLDNTVAGGIASGETAMESLIREAEEEASLPPELVRSQAKHCGTVTYFYARDERAGGETGLLQPECQYVFDLELGADVIPKENDNEVESFRLCTLKEVQDALARDEFKPNCAMVMLDFLIRHGILTPDNEPHYIEIVSRLHRKFEFPTA